MKKSVGPLAILVAVAVLIAFCYAMYQVTNPTSLGAYNAKYGPPAYIKNSPPGGRAGYTGRPMQPVDGQIGTSARSAGP